MREEKEQMARGKKRGRTRGDIMDCGNEEEDVSL